MIAVKTIFNTDENGERVSEDLDEDDCPAVYHGPFETIEAAVYWMNEVYPDGDTDVVDQYVDDYDIPVEWLNDPNTLFRHADGAAIGTFFQGFQPPKL